MKVVSGLLALSDGRVLMGLRRSDKLRPNLWELPGGKVEDGESPEDALVREWREELGVEVRVASSILAESHMDVEAPIGIMLYQVVIVGDGQPKAIDHKELRWYCPSDAVRHLPCSPGFYLQYQAILAASGEVLR